MDNSNSNDRLQPPHEGSSLTTSSDRKARFLGICIGVLLMLLTWGSIALGVHRKAQVEAQRVRYDSLQNVLRERRVLELALSVWVSRDSLRREDLKRSIAQVPDSLLRRLTRACPGCTLHLPENPKRPLVIELGPVMKRKLEPFHGGTRH